MRIVSIYFKGGFNRNKVHSHVSLHSMLLWFSSSTVGITHIITQIQLHYVEEKKRVTSDLILTHPVDTN